MELRLASIGRVQGWLVALGPALLIALMAWVPGEQNPNLLVLISGLVSAGGLLFTRRPIFAKLLSSLGFAGTVFLLWPKLLMSPAMALAVFILVSLVFKELWGTRSLAFRSVKARQLLDTGSSNESFRILAWGALLTWFFALALGRAFDPSTHLAVMASVLFCTGLGVKWVRSVERNRRMIHFWFYGSLFALAISLWGLWDRPVTLITVWLCFPLSALVIAREREEKSFMNFIVELLLEHPARILVFTFVSLSAFTAFLLYLPESQAHGGGISFLDAAFTAVSAVCITGLSVLDTGKDFSFLGQMIILIGIQVGGLGMMTFYTAAFAALGRRLSLQHERALGSMMGGGQHIGEVILAIRKIFAITFVSEIIGALILTWCFMRNGEPWGEAIWRGVFTSISAFCNAGFALTSDSLMSYQSDPLILHTVGALIVLGGLSPMAVFALPRLLKRERLNLQAKLILTSTVSLLVLGFLAFVAFEWGQSLAPLSFGDRLHNAWFQSLTTRSSGFNSVDVSQLQPTTQVMVLVLMWIGGAPGGTAGGIKVTTMALLFLAVLSTFRGSPQVSVFGRRIPHSSIYRSAAVVSVSLLMMVSSILMLLLTQSIPTDALVFEAVSALGTVGLSMGATTRLDEIGKFVIMACMLAGRVGPLTLFLLLASSTRPRKSWNYPEEEVAVG